MIAIPAEVFEQIFAFLPQSTVKDCRLLSRHVSNTATALAFQHVRLEAAGNASRFVSVALSDSLRHLVREVTIDTRVGPSAMHVPGEGLHPWQNLLIALPLIRFFTGLKTVNLRFSEFCGNANPRDWRVELRCRPLIEESYDHRFLVLDALFHCLAGTWSSKIQASHEEIKSRLFRPRDPQDVLNALVADTSTRDDERQAPIAISTLTISNLADFNDERITLSDAFRRVVESRALKRLKLLVVKEMDHHSSGLTPFFSEKYDFFESLPETWLSPPVAQNLRVLSLFRWDYWGWCPKMDFRCVNPANGPNSGFPNLRVLALGKYVLSHDWQIDWLASVGRQNGRGGLEELYLDDCPILWRARTISPLDESTTTSQSPDGNTIEVSNSGYPRKEIMVSHPVTQPNDHATFDYHLRWKQVLDHWREHMIGLKVFRMGVGAWNGHLLANLEPTGDAAERKGATKGSSREPSPLENMRNIARRSYRARGNVFLNYNCPSPPREEVPVTKLAWDPRYEHGVGIESESRHVLHYIYFDVGLMHTPWTHQHDRCSQITDLGPGGSRTAQIVDEEAYEQFCNSVRERCSLRDDGPG